MRTELEEQIRALAVEKAWDCDCFDAQVVPGSIRLGRDGWYIDVQGTVWGIQKRMRAHVRGTPGDEAALEAISCYVVG